MFGATAELALFKGIQNKYKKLLTVYLVILMLFFIGAEIYTFLKVKLTLKYYLVQEYIIIANVN